MNTDKYYVWSCPCGALAAGTAETLGDGSPPWAFHGYSYVGSCITTSAEAAREYFSVRG